MSTRAERSTHPKENRQTLYPSRHREVEEYQASPSQVASSCDLAALAVVNRSSPEDQHSHSHDQLQLHDQCLLHNLCLLLSLCQQPEQFLQRCLCRHKEVPRSRELCRNPLPIKFPSLNLMELYCPALTTPALLSHQPHLLTSLHHHLHRQLPQSPQNLHLKYYTTLLGKAVPSLAW